MINLRNSPFLWFSLVLILAVMTGGKVHQTLALQLQIAMYVLFLITLFLTLKKYLPGTRIWSTLAITLMMFIAGLLRHQHFIKEVFPGSSVNMMIEGTGLLEVDEVLKQKPSSATLKCQILSLVDTTGEQIVKDKFIVLYVRNTGIRDFFPGDILSVQGQVSALPAPMNPDAFDMRKYYRTIGIRHQLRADDADVNHLSMKVRSVMRTTAIWQKQLCDIVRQNTSSPVAQLTNALVWGERKNMDDDIRKAFADSGAMHVLSVSGMHMAMIYSMLYLILGSPGSGSMLKRNIRLALYGVAIILYMGLTGACPAVVRSGLMILLYLLGKAMGWNTQIWNLLGFAAFLMIWSNPYVIYNIGFQLSFLAMAGILLYAKPLIRTFTFSSILLHRVWEVSAVSIAAQVFILPLLLFHFYQFPLTFIASSLVAMPASYVIIFGSLLNILLSPLEWEWLWKCFDTASVWFIDIMKWMARLNPSMNYSLPDAAAWMMAAMGILFSAGLIYQWNMGRKIAWIMAIGIVTHLITHRVKVWHSHELTIYHQYKGLLADIVADGYCYTLSDSLVTRDSEDFAARGNRCRQDVIKNFRIQKEEPCATRHWSYTPPVIQTDSKKIVIWNDINISPDVPGLTHLIVQQPVRLRELENLLCAQQEITVIIPAHIRGYSLTKLKTIIQRTEAASIEINLSGAMVLEL